METSEHDLWNDQYWGNMEVKELASAEPILPKRRIHKLQRAPETPGGPLALKYVLILVWFWIWPAAMKTWIMIYCNAVLSPFLRNNLSNHVTWLKTM